MTILAYLKFEKETVGLKKKNNFEYPYNNKQQRDLEKDDQVAFWKRSFLAQRSNGLAYCSKKLAQFIIGNEDWFDGRYKRFMFKKLNTNQLFQRPTHM